MSVFIQARWKDPELDRVGGGPTPEFMGPFTMTRFSPERRRRKIVSSVAAPMLEGRGEGGGGMAARKTKREVPPPPLSLPPSLFPSIYLSRPWSFL